MSSYHPQTIGHRHHICDFAVAAELAGTAPSPPQLTRALESPFAGESSQDTPPQAKRGRPKGSTKKSKTANSSEAGTEAEPAKAAAPSAAASTAKARKRNGVKHTKAEATLEPEVAASMEAAEEAADGDDYTEADGEGDAAARLDMARKASTGDGSRLERPAADSDDTSFNSIAQAGTLAQLDSCQAESKQDAGVTNEGGTMMNGSRVFNPTVCAAGKPPHRLSKVTGTYSPSHPDLIAGLLWHRHRCIQDQQARCLASMLANARILCF